jgi:hypothetical protein
VLSEVDHIRLLVRFTRDLVAFAGMSRTPHQRAELFAREFAQTNFALSPRVVSRTLAQRRVPKIVADHFESKRLECIRHVRQVPAVHSIPVHKIRIAVTAMASLALDCKLRRFQETVQVVRAISARAPDLQRFQ